MHVTLLDTSTGETRESSFSDRSPQWWIEGGGSCDCNREIAMYGLRYDSSELNRRTLNRCVGCSRYLVVDIGGDLEGYSRKEIFEEINSDYPPELVAKWAEKYSALQ